MQKIGLIGGMSWTSTVRYYQIINGAIHDRLGGLHSAPMLMESLDFAAVAQSNTDEEWARTADILIGAAQRLEMAGATALVICANRSDEHTSELQSLMRISYAVFCLKKKIHKKKQDK